MDKPVVLTFDDGPSPYTDELLELLAADGVRAAFFLKGATLDESHPDHAENRKRVRRIQEQGHEICNHTFSDPDLTKLSDSEIRDEMTKAEALIGDVTGRRTHCMRPPYNAYDDRVLGIMRDLGYRVVLPSYDTEDWLYASTEAPSTFDPQKVLGSVEHIIVCTEEPLIHVQQDTVSTRASIQLVPDVIDRLRAGGYEPTSLSNCLGGTIDAPR